MSTMRESYRFDLEALGFHGARMCRAACGALDQATKALMNADLALAEEVLSLDVRFDEMQAEAEGAALELLALQAPVAGDLRLIVTSLRIVGEIRRMGALALHVAGAARRQHPMHAIPGPIAPTFQRMSDQGVRVAGIAATALEEQDVELAASLRGEDGQLDDYQQQLFGALADPAWSAGIAPAVTTALLSRFYERFGDHAVEIGRHVIYLVTGTYPPPLAKTQDD
jgi:phosphate transport system protein